MFSTIILATVLSATPVRVGTAGSAPFANAHGEGIATEIWKNVAKKKEIDYELVNHFDSVEEALSAKHDGQIDVVVGSVTINSHRKKTYGDFSQPYFEANMGVMSRRSESIVAYIKPFFNSNFFFSLFVFVSLLFLVGSVIWLAERKNNSAFQKGFKGILEGAWFSLVTMTTVGYGDKVPRTSTGRFLTVIWMLVGILMFSSLTAFLTSAFESKGEGIENISNKRIAIVQGTTGEIFARNRGAKILATKNLEEAIEALKAEKVDGVVFDGPALQFHLKKDNLSDFSVHLYSESSENYGFMLDIDIDAEILEMKESGEIQSITNRWISEI